MTEAARSEFQIVPLKQVVESKTNPRRHFDEKGLEELTSSVKSHGVLVPLLVRARTNGSTAAAFYEIVAGARRYRAATGAGLEEIPVRIRDFTDSQVLEIQVIENLQREDVHPLDEALGYHALMKKAGYDVDSIAAKVGKSSSYVYQRLKLADLIEPAKKLFFEEEITAGHAILIARLEPKDQERALESCFDPFRRAVHGERIISSSVRELNAWIQNNLHLDLHAAPFKKDDADLVPAAGACVTCPKRTGFIPALFPDIAKKDTCTDRAYFQAKTKAHVAQRKSELEASGTQVVEISTQYGWSGNDEKKKDRPLLNSEYSRIAGKKDRCESAQKAIVVAGDKDLGHVVDICRDPKCKVHHGGGRASSQGSLEDIRRRAEDRRKEEKARNETTLRRRILDGILAVGRKEPSTEDLRLIALGFWGRTWHENQKLIANRRGWDTKGYMSETGEKAIATVEASELVNLLLELSLIAHTSIGVYNDVTDKKLLLETAKRYKVDVKSIEKQFNAELAEKKAKKAAREKAKTKAAKAGTKSAKAETNGAKRKTNGAESETPAPAHVHAGPKPRKGEHACEVCKCTEAHACEGGCWWDPKYLAKKRYVCSNCPKIAAARDPGPRRRKAVQPSANEASV